MIIRRESGVNAAGQLGFHEDTPVEPHLPHRSEAGLKAAAVDVFRCARVVVDDLHGEIRGHDGSVRHDVPQSWVGPKNSSFEMDDLV